MTVHPAKLSARPRWGCCRRRAALAAEVDQPRTSAERVPLARRDLLHHAGWPGAACIPSGKLRT